IHHLQFYKKYSCSCPFHLFTFIAHFIIEGREQQKTNVKNGEADKSGKPSAVLGFPVCWQAQATMSWRFVRTRTSCPLKPNTTNVQSTKALHIEGLADI